RLVKSTQNNNYESLRFINSAGAFSPDGRYFAIAAKRKDRDDLVILDVQRGREERRIHVGLSGLQTPQWSPDGQQLVFTGINNVFLYDLADGQIYQLTNMFTGVQGITPLSPVLTWAPQADRMAFVYYEDGQYSVYSVENPRSLRRAPYHGAATQPVVTLLQAEERATILQAP